MNLLGRVEAMDEDQIRAFVEYALGVTVSPSRIIRLSGKQGLEVCRIECGERGNYIFKCVTEAGKLELRLTAYLSEIAPFCICPVIRYEEDEKRHLYWILEGDAGEDRLLNHPTLENYLKVAAQLARLQREAMDHVQGLQNLGMPLMMEEKWEILGLHLIQMLDKMSDPLISKFRGELERLLWKVDELARDACIIPCSLIHGDLHAGNISCNPSGENVIFLDWGSAYLAPMLLGIEELLMPSTPYLRDREMMERVRSSYLKQFQPILGKMSLWGKSAAACCALVNMHMTLDALGNYSIGQMDVYATARQMSLLVQSMRQWECM